MSLVSIIFRNFVKIVIFVILKMKVRNQTILADNITMYKHTKQQIQNITT